MKNKWTNNLLLKISSLILAGFIWILVMNAADPELSRTRNVPLEIRNADIITEAGKAYTTDVGNTVTVSYRVRARDESLVRSSDFKAVADMKNMYDVTGAIPITVEVMDNRDRILGTPTVRPAVLHVVTEDLQRKTFTITSTTEGTPAAGYAVKQVVLEETEVVVTGPKSQIGKISSVGVSIDVEGASESLSGKAPLKYLDANGNPIGMDPEQVTNSFDEVDYQVTIVSGRSLSLNCLWAVLRLRGTALQGYAPMSVPFR